MHALILSNFGDASQLAWREVPSPHPGAGEILVELTATSVNPFDVALRSGRLRYVPVELPAILGRDLAGVVIAVGPGVAGFRVGDRVMAVASQTYAEEVVVPALAVTHVPHALALSDAGALPLVLTTGGQLVGALPLVAGRTVLVTGAAGMVGRAAVYSARRRGLRVIAGVRAHQLAGAASLGADAVIALDDDSSLAALPPLDGIADTVGPGVLKRLLPSLVDGGAVATIVGEAPPGGRKVVASPDARLLADLATAVARGELRIPIVQRLPLAKGAEAHALVERGVGGKVLLTA